MLAVTPETKILRQEKAGELLRNYPELHEFIKKVWLPDSALWWLGDFRLLYRAKYPDMLFIYQILWVGNESPPPLRLEWCWPCLDKEPSPRPEPQELDGQQLMPYVLWLMLKGRE